MPRGRGNGSPPDCHPDRPARGGGLCDRCYGKWWRKNHPRPKGQRRAAAHRLTLEELGALLADARCAICGATNNLHIDHDHACCPPARHGGRRSCGRCIRGVLCQDCNLGLGRFGDDPLRLASAIAYLTRNR